MQVKTFYILSVNVWYRLSSGDLLDHLHRIVLLSEGGGRHSASWGRSQSFALVWSLHPGRLSDRSHHHVPAGQCVPGFPSGSGLCQQLQLGAFWTLSHSLCAFLVSRTTQWGAKLEDEWRENLVLVKFYTLELSFGFYIILGSNAKNIYTIIHAPIILAFWVLLLQSSVSSFQIRDQLARFVKVFASLQEHFWKTLNGNEVQSIMQMHFALFIMCKIFFWQINIQNYWNKP